MAEAEPGTGVFGLEFDRAPVGCSGRGSAGRRRQRGRQQKVGVGAARIGFDGLLEALYGLGEAVFVLVQASQVDDRAGEVRRQPHRLREQFLGIPGMTGLHGDHAQQPQRGDVFRVVLQDAAIQLLGFLYLSRAVQTCGLREVPLLRVQREAALESRVGLATLAIREQCTAEMEMRLFQVRVEGDGTAQHVLGLVAAPLL